MKSARSNQGRDRLTFLADVKLGYRPEETAFVLGSVQLFDEMVAATPAAYLAKVAAQVQERQARTDLIVLSHAGYLQTLGRGRSTSYRRTEKPLP
jgi:hypothetical protein